MKGVTVLASLALLLLVNFLHAQLKKAGVLPADVALREFSSSPNVPVISIAQTAPVQTKPSLNTRKLKRV